MGRKAYTVSNINRANPNPSLFQVPAGFTENHNMQHNVIRPTVTHEIKAAVK